jgi:hypothetical protein
LIAWLAAGCTPTPPGWQRPLGVLGILIGLAAIVFSGQIAAWGQSSRPVNIAVGTAFVVIGTLALIGVIHFHENCPAG